VPKVSVLLGSSRPGGIDVSLLGLEAQTYDDFEVIFVDGRYHQRHGLVLDAVERSGLKAPFFHVPNHRYGEPPWTSICAGFNTGFMLAAGEIVIMLCDYAYAPPGWIEAHLACHTEPGMVVAPHRYREMPPTVTIRNDYESTTHFLDPITVDAVLSSSVQPQEVNDSKLVMPDGPVNHLYMHTKNESFPLDNVLAIGGMDENYDRGRGPGDHCIGHRLIDSGLQGWLCGAATVEVLNPRGIMPNPNIAIGEENLGERWGIVTGNAYYHATANRKRANNPYNIWRRRNDIWHWRELSQNLEAVIPKNIVPDAEYFSKCEFQYP